MNLDAKNPFAEPSALTFGLPDYQSVTLPDLDAAIRAGMEQQATEWEAIATNPEPATAENTLVALDDSGGLLSRAMSVFWTLCASVGGAELDVLQDELTPLLTAHANLYQLDARLYRRYIQLRGEPSLDAESRWTVEQAISDFEREGVNLSEADQHQLRDLDVRIATLETVIEQKIARQLDMAGLSGDDLAELSGLDEATLSFCRDEGAARGRGWFIPVRNYSTQPSQSVLNNPEVRRTLLDVSLNRGTGGDDISDARTEIIELADARARRAALLGFPDHVTMVVETETAPSADAIEEMLGQVGRAAQKRVKEEAAALHRLADSDPNRAGFEAADWPYYENQLRGRQLGFDEQTLRPYLHLDRVLEDGAFWAARQLYGIKMVRRRDLLGWHEDVRVWEVQEESGEPLGLFLADLFSRPGKQGGAWMADIQEACSRTGTVSIVSNDANFTKPAEGEPALLTWDEVETVFHEFGHALHGLFSVTRYRDNSGTNVPRDFVELPSQLNEMWAFHPAVLRNFARHYQTGEPLPEAAFATLTNSKTFGQGFATAEYVAAAVIDHAWHRGAGNLLPQSPDQIADFEDASLAAAGYVRSVRSLVPPRYRSAYFAHTFAGGYDGAYYAYMWAEMLCAEVETWFRTVAAEDGDGGLNRSAGTLLRDELLSRGNSRPPLVSFQKVTGKPATVQSVLRRRGLQ